MKIELKTVNDVGIKLEEVSEGICITFDNWQYEGVDTKHIEYSFTFTTDRDIDEFLGVLRHLRKGYNKGE